jgi:hypothetical protein
MLQRDFETVTGGFQDRFYYEGGLDMLTKTELNRRFDAPGQALPDTVYARSSGKTSTVNARRLRRQRREAANAYRAPTGWSVGLW